MKKKPVILPVRMDKELKDSFMRIIESQDTSASQIIRMMIRKYIREHDQMNLDL